MSQQITCFLSDICNWMKTHTADWKRPAIPMFPNIVEASDPNGNWDWPGLKVIFLLQNTKIKICLWNRSWHKSQWSSDASKLPLRGFKNLIQIISNTWSKITGYF